MANEDIKQTIKQTIGGLKELEKDERDFSLGAIFTLPALSELPEEYLLETLEIKNQGDTDMCAAFAATTLSEIQEEVLLSPEYAFAKTKEIEGDFLSWGTNLRSICKMMTKIGIIEAKDTPYSL